MPFSAATAAAIVATHAVAALGAWTAARAGVPLAWIIGSLLSVAALGLAGAPVRSHRAIRDHAIVVVMTALGLTFTPEAAGALVRLLPEMVFAAFATVAIGCVTARILTRTARVDLTTAFFASVPGGPVEMSLMGERNGARVAEIAMSQLLRIVFLVLTIPPALTLSGVTGDVPSIHGMIPVNGPGLAATLGLSLGAAMLARRAGLQTAFLLMPMAVGVSLDLTEAHLSAVPKELSDAAQVVMGTYLGSQFRRESVAALRRFMPAAILNVVLLTLGCVVLAALIGETSGISTANLILATAPGSVTEMAITAKVLQYDVPLITAFHLLRIFLVVSTVPLVYAGLKRVGFFGRGVDRGTAGDEPDRIAARSPAE